MNHRTLGNVGEVSEVGYGAWQIGERLGRRDRVRGGRSGRGRPRRRDRLLRYRRRVRRRALGAGSRRRARRRHRRRRGDGRHEGRSPARPPRPRRVYRDEPPAVREPIAREPRNGDAGSGPASLPADGCVLPAGDVRRARGPLPTKERSRTTGSASSASRRDSKRSSISASRRSRSSSIPSASVPRSCSSTKPPPATWA